VGRRGAESIEINPLNAGTDDVAAVDARLIID
jgi:hypothetical protein